VIFSEMTRSKPFNINRVVSSEAMPMERPNIDKIVAVLTNPLL
jgi:hypothetical protein